MEDSDVLLRLTTDQALLLGEVLKTFTDECEIVHYFPNDPIESLAYRLMNSAIDPIIAQLEEELEQLGVR